jgi:4-hydroxy-tetrahydrodipicolinate synthase
MDRNSVDWHGVIPALVTPFTADGAIDEDKFRRNVALMVEQGAHGVLVGGCTAEFWAMSDDERDRLVRIAADEIKGRVRIIAGTSAIRPDDVIARTRAAEKNGADGALVLPPYFVKPCEDDIVAFYQLVSDKTGLPLMLYNIPANAVNAITPALADRLAAIDHVVAIKESQGDWANFHRTLNAVRDRLRVFCGPSSVYGMAATSLGAVGHIDCFPNIWCRPMVAMWKAAESKDMARAAPLQQKAFELTQLCTSWEMNLYVSTKAAMNILGLPGGYPRLPLRPLSAQLEARLRDGLARLGLEPAAAARAAARSSGS